MPTGLRGVTSALLTWCIMSRCLRLGLFICFRLNITCKGLRKVRKNRGDNVKCQTKNTFLNCISSFKICLPSCFNLTLLTFCAPFLFIVNTEALAQNDNQSLFDKGVNAYNAFSEKGIDESISLFEEVISLASDNVLAHAALSESYVQKYLRGNKRDGNLIDKAHSASQKALQLDPEKAETHKASGSVYFARGEINKATEAIKIALDMNPQYARAWLSLGACLLALDERDDADRAFTKAIDLANDPLAEALGHYSLAIIQSLQNEHLFSLENFEKAALGLPLYYNVFYGKGVALMNLERDEEALDAFKEASALKPDSADAYYGIASANHRLKNIGPARQAYESALALDPDMEGAQRGLMALESKKVGCLYFY